MTSLHYHLKTVVTGWLGIIDFQNLIPQVLIEQQIHPLVKTLKCN